MARTDTETTQSGQAGPAATVSTVAAGAGPGPRQRGGPRRGGPQRGGPQRGGLRKSGELTLLLGPALVLFIGFVFVPIVIAAYYSLYNWSGYGPLKDFTGLHNYKVAFNDPVFIQAIEHTLII